MTIFRWTYKILAIVFASSFMATLSIAMQTAEKVVEKPEMVITEINENGMMLLKSNGHIFRLKAINIALNKLSETIKTNKIDFLLMPRIGGSVKAKKFFDAVKNYIIKEDGSLTIALIVCEPDAYKIMFNEQEKFANTHTKHATHIKILRGKVEDALEVLYNHKKNCGINPALFTPGEGRLHADVQEKVKILKTNPSTNDQSVLDYISSGGIASKWPLEYDLVKKAGIDGNDSIGNWPRFYMDVDFLIIKNIKTLNKKFQNNIACYKENNTYRIPMAKAGDFFAVIDGKNWQAFLLHMLMGNQQTSAQAYVILSKAIVANKGDAGSERSNSAKLSLFLDPITKDPLSEATLSPSGHNFEKAVFEVWAQEVKKDPLTSMDLIKSTGELNLALQSAKEALNQSPTGKIGYKDARAALEHVKQIKSRDFALEEFLRTFLGMVTNEEINNNPKIKELQEQIYEFLQSL